ncbi:SRPBCC family protein [Amycolatopsis sp. H20-H5]|uniref:SRPBCC family protein n=1 Tax=Amycolatopsis sp. H20-H5 TaxID=3046309 RepID=UPI002DB5E50D|nr:SRPBCC family protein [Amycolatopsis sp. H20-H5]MEC3974255.1 SRPBCC family protein [Amycolatopsis sp. H20-H5]
MAARTENSVHVKAPFELVWDITNDVPGWPRLFSEYAGAEVLETRPGYLRFRLTMHPDEQGRVWSWVSERELDRSSRTVLARRVETGPFEYMNIRWTYEPADDGGTVMRWVQEFQMKRGAPVDDAGMRDRINSNSAIQLDLIKNTIEGVAAAKNLRDYVLPGVGGIEVDLSAKAGKPLIVVLGNRVTQKAGHDLVDALRTDPITAEVPIVQVAHLQGVPRSLHKIAERDIAGGRRKQVERAEKLRAAEGLATGGEDEAIGLALDWQGVLGRDHGFGARDKAPLTLVTDTYLSVLTVIRTADALPGIRAALDSITVKEEA